MDNTNFQLLKATKPLIKNIKYQNLKDQNGFTLFEVIIVVSLIALIYSVAVPDFSLSTNTERTIKIGELAGDIRKAYDMSVLYKKPFRIVIGLGSDKYWLESTDTPNFYLSNEKAEFDEGKNAVQDEIARIEEEFEEYQDLAGNEVSDPDNDRVIPPSSPVLKAKNLLLPPQWTAVTSDQWGMKSMRADLVFIDMQSEHHAKQQTIDVYSDEAEPAKTYIYVFPSGYIEKAVVHVAIKKSDTEIDQSVEPYTIITNPYLGTAEVESGYQDVPIEK